MKKIGMVIFLSLLLCVNAFASNIKVNIKVRGTSGIEPRVENILARELGSFERVKIVEDKRDCHFYLDIALVEQEQIRFYGMGISMAYRLYDDIYSRPSSDVAQFGEDRLEDVCVYLAKEINKGFLDPLRRPVVE